MESLVLIAINTDPGLNLSTVIEQSGVQFCLKLHRCAKQERSAKYDFRLKLHSAQFNYHFITSIWKSHNFIARLFQSKGLGNQSCKISHTTAFFAFHIPAILWVTLNKHGNLISFVCFFFRCSFFIGWGQGTI